MFNAAIALPLQCGLEVVIDETLYSGEIWLPLQGKLIIICYLCCGSGHFDSDPDPAFHK